MCLIICRICKMCAPSSPYEPLPFRMTIWQICQKQKNIFVWGLFIFCIFFDIFVIRKEGWGGVHILWHICLKFVIRKWGGGFDIFNSMLRIFHIVHIVHTFHCSLQLLSDHIRYWQDFIFSAMTRKCKKILLLLPMMSSFLTLQFSSLKSDNLLHSISMGLCAG